MTLNEIVQIVKIVEKIEKRKESRLKTKSKVNHMNTRTTKNTIQISDSAQRELSQIGEQIVKLLDRSLSIEEIRQKLKTQVGSIISNAVRESYLLGFHFIESFKERTIKLTEEHIQEINLEIEKQIEAFWVSVTRIIEDSKKSKSTIAAAAGPRDLFLLNLFNKSFSRSAVSMSFLALNQATVTTQRQVFREEVPEAGIVVTGSLKVPQSIWVSERDNRVCPICLNLDGRTWDVDDSSMPRPVSDSHRGCRCRLLPLDGGRVFNA